MGSPAVPIALPRPYSDPLILKPGEAQIAIRCGNHAE
jgi:hypothetical protein